LRSTHRAAEVWTRPVTTTATASLAAASARLAGRTYLARANWGADESLRFDANGVELYPQTYWPVQTLTVHHTATANDDSDPAATVRAIYADHLSPEKDFGDIGYHLLIDELGRVYEGRYSGDDVFPAHDPSGELMVNAAHVGGFNAGNIGVALLGDFTSQLPTAAAQRTLLRVLAVLAARHEVDPQAPVNYVNPISSAMETVLGISGHRDWLATQCPGNLFAPELDGIRADVARLLTTMPVAGALLT
jgi:hypothetical protein